jgi:hypothetical protein
MAESETTASGTYDVVWYNCEGNNRHRSGTTVIRTTDTVESSRLTADLASTTRWEKTQEAHVYY